MKARHWQARMRQLQLAALALSGSVLLGGCYVAPIAPVRVSGAVVVRPEGGGCWHHGWHSPDGELHPGHWGVCR